MALGLQRYVSNDLSHFVGRDLLGRPETQYERLKAILGDGSLRRPRQPDEAEGTRYAVRVDAEGSISKNEMYFGTAVCFCDIREDLRIHVGKYGPFGLAFPKGFLIDSGASPVFYIAREARTSTVASGYHDIPRGDAFDGEFLAYLDFIKRRSKVEHEAFSERIRADMERSRRTGELLGEIGSSATRRSGDPSAEMTGALEELSRLHEEDEAARQRSRRDFERLEAYSAWAEHRAGPPPPRTSDPEIGWINHFLSMYVFSFFKFFDASLEEDHPENYYMEREWRTPGDVAFSLQDVRSVFLPERFAEAFRRDFPAFRGQVLFL